MKVKQLLQTLAAGLLLSATLSTFAPLARGQLQTIHSFQGSDGASPHAEVVPGNDGNFYGTTLYGGANSLGTVFKITPGGVLTALDIFDGSNGRYPQAGLVQGSDGFFYGTTKGDAGSIPGTAFRTTSIGGLTTLATFTSANNGGLYSLGTLIQASDGTFYGTTPYGGLNTAGTVFQLTTGGTLTTVVKFNQSNGSQPFAGLIGGSDGNFYGTTAGGGANNKGTVFQLTPNGSNSVLTTLVSFNGANGAVPAGVLLQTSGGDFYGTTRDGGANNKGTVFKMTANGTNSTLTTLASFNGANGSSPWCGLVLASDGNFYGTTQQGGDLSANSGYGWGTVFQLTPAGVLTAVVAFNNSNGSEPFGGLVKGTDGNLYGTTHSGGTIGWGTVFKFGITSACAQMTCATNKTVECGSAWAFDAPTNIVDACCTNYTLSFSTVTNGACPQVIIRTWMISDVCGNTNICSQTVTVVDTTPPVITCATNKTVEYGAAWSFDAPTASDACSGTNVTITVLNTLTNDGPCTQWITRTWRATDGCSNSASCSQTVTLVDTSPSAITCPPLVVDNFSPINPAPGDIITIIGSGFRAGVPDDHNITLNHNGLLIDVECLTADSNVLTGRLSLGPPSADGQPHDLEVRLGTGLRLDLISPDPNVQLGREPAWIWGAFNPSVGIASQKAFPSFKTPDNNFYGGPPQNGELTLRLGQDLEAGVSYYFNAQIRPQGATVGTRVNSMIFLPSGTRYDSANTLSNLIKLVFASHPLFPLDVNCNVFSGMGGDALINITMANGTPIIAGSISISIPRSCCPYCAVLDLKADALEIVQASQDLNNSVPLVADKPTFVRGYAHIVANTCGPHQFFPGARLTGVRNGVQLAGWQNPLNNPMIDNNGNLDQLRPDTNRSFLFQLPHQWVQPGNLTLTMQIDPNGLIPENVPTANNSVSASAAVFHKGDPCLVMVPIWTTSGYYDGITGLADIIARARSLLPVHDFQLYNDPNPIRKPYLHVHIEAKLTWDPYFPWGPIWVNYSVFEVGYEPYDMSQDLNWGLMLSAVVFRKSLSSIPFGCTDAHWLGTTLKAGGGGIQGIGVPCGRSLVVRMNNCPTCTSPAWDRPPGGHTLAHELGHNYCRGHINQASSGLNCGGVSPGFPLDPFYPYDPCTIGPVTGSPAIYGFDPISQLVITPTGAADLMTYASLDWISGYNWNNMFGQTPAFAPLQSPVLSGLSSASAGPFLLVQGSILPIEGLAEFGPFYLLEAGVADAQNVADSLAATAQLPSDHLYKLRLVGDQGTVLATVPLTTINGADGPSNVLVFVQFVPYDARTRQLQLLSGNTVLTERAASSNPPTVSLAPPVVNAAAQTLQLSWSASDADQQLLFFTVQYSADNGASWQVLEANYPYLGLTVSTRSLPGGSQARVRVIATDGVLSSLATSAPFALGRHAPEPQIGTLHDGQRVSFGSVLQLQGLALDAEDGSIPASNLLWTVSGPTPLTDSGQALSLASLSPGSYTATLRATDSDGQSGSATLRFDVSPMPVTAGDSPVLDGLAADAGYTNAAVARLLFGGEVAPVRLLHSGTNLFVCFTDLPYDTNAPGGTRAGLRLDVNASADARAQKNDVGFYVDENGELLRLAGNGDTMVSVPLSADFAAAVTRGRNAWGAELRLPDSLLGGTNHFAGLMLSYETTSQTNPPARWPASAEGDQPRTWASIFFGWPSDPPNQPPVAVAGPSRLLNVVNREPVVLNGTGSFGPDGNPLSFSWMQVSGPPVTLADSTSATPSFVAESTNVPVTLRFRLVVNDGQTDSAATTNDLTLIPAPRQPSISKELASQMQVVDGLFRWELFGEAGRRYRIQASTNLIDWQSVHTNHAVDFYRTFQFTDPATPKQPERFYRVLPE